MAAYDNIADNRVLAYAGLMKLLLPFAMLVAVAYSAQAAGPEVTIGSGRYCQKEWIEAYTGRPPAVPLGYFIMMVSVMREGRQYTVRIANRLPDSPQILDVRTDHANVLRDGSLAFSFIDGWGNSGRARVYSSGRVVLVMTNEAEGDLNQIGRNYGTFNVSRSRCSADVVRQF